MARPGAATPGVDAFDRSSCEATGFVQTTSILPGRPSAWYRSASAFFDIAGHRTTGGAKSDMLGGDDTDLAAFRRARESGAPGGAAELRRHQRDPLPLGPPSPLVRARGFPVPARPLGGGS